MSEIKQEQRKKRGFIPWLQQKLGIGSRGPVGTTGPSSGAVASSENIAANIGKIAAGGRIITPQGVGGLAGLFSSKAGIMGVILGGATIAAGIGVLYNFIGPSSKPVYSPGLFQDSFLKSQAEQASQERAAMDNYSGSSLDFFKEQAQKELGTEDSQKDSAESEASADGSDVAGSGEGNVPQSAGSGANQIPKLQTSGFGTQIPRMSGGGGGLFGGVGGSFQGTLKQKPQVVSAKPSSMKRALASTIVQSKHNVPKYNKKGAYGQAKYAGKVGGQAPFSASDAGMRTTATEAFSGETTGAGDVGTPAGGAGVGGQGLGSVPSLKGNDPNLNTNENTPGQLNNIPKPKETENPWDKFQTWAIYAGLASMALTLVTHILANIAKATPWVYTLAYITGYAAIAAALVVVAFGVYMIAKWKQTWTGIMYILMGMGLVMAAIKALQGVGQAATKNGVNLGKDSFLKAGYNQNQAQLVRGNMVANDMGLKFGQPPAANNPTTASTIDSFNNGMKAGGFNQPSVTYDGTITNNAGQTIPETVNIDDSLKRTLFGEALLKMFGIG